VPQAMNLSSQFYTIIDYLGTKHHHFISRWPSSISHACSLLPLLLVFP